MKNFVYLVKSKNKLIVTSMAVNNPDYIVLLASEGPQSFEYCKMYCMGAMVGNQAGSKFANTLSDFQ
jgi:hypothetical protein